MDMKRSIVAGALLAAAGCAQVPTGPTVMVLPGRGKTAEQFQADDNVCRQLASQEVERTKGGQVPAQGRYDMAYMQCMHAKGHQLTQAPSRTTASPPASPGTPTAAPLTWPPTPAQIDCEGRGGVWRAALDFCEFPSPDRRWRH
jgi:hypothetical protein